MMKSDWDWWERVHKILKIQNIQESAKISHRYLKKMEFIYTITKTLCTVENAILKNTSSSFNQVPSSSFNYFQSEMRRLELALRDVRETYAAVLAADETKGDDGGLDKNEDLHDCVIEAFHKNIPNGAKPRNNQSPALHNRRFNHPHRNLTQAPQINYRTWTFSKGNGQIWATLQSSGSANSNMRPTLSIGRTHVRLLQSLPI